MTRNLILSALLAGVATTAGAQMQTQVQTAPAPAQTSRPTTSAAAPQSGMPATMAPNAARGAPMASTTAPAATANPSVGGAAMDATKPIAVNASAAPNLSTLVTAVKAAGLDATLSGPGPFTVFAPTNDAFGRLASGTVDTLMKPANKASLVKVLTYHVVPGTITLADLTARLTSGGGRATLTSVEGSTLIVAKEGNAISLTDVSGNKSYIEVPDVRQSNGVVHVVNGVLVPKLG